MGNTTSQTHVEEENIKPSSTINTRDIDPEVQTSPNSFESESLNEIEREKERANDNNNKNSTNKGGKKDNSSTSMVTKNTTHLQTMSPVSPDVSPSTTKVGKSNHNSVGRTKKKK